MKDIKLCDYQISDITARFIKYSNRWDIKSWLTNLLSRTNDTVYTEFKQDVERLVSEYVEEIQRLQICGILYGPCNEKMIYKYLFGVDSFGASVCPRFINDFNRIVDEYKGR